MRNPSNIISNTDIGVFKVAASGNPDAIRVALGASSKTSISPDTARIIAEEIRAAQQSGPQNNGSMG